MIILVGKFSGFPFIETKKLTKELQMEKSQSKQKSIPLTYEYLNSIIRYDEHTGELFNKVPRGLKTIGERAEANTADASTGYLNVNIRKKKYHAHRIAWFLHCGEMPKLQIDHIDHNKLNNKITNLREVTHRENSLNRGINKNNTSGTVGVIWCKRDSKWRVSIRVNYKKIHLGHFFIKEEAIKARRHAERIYGFHKNHGKDL